MKILYSASTLFGLIFCLSISAQNPYKIPVVVHVIHYDGAENITEAQIKNGIDILTRNWRKQNPDTLEIVPIFRPIAADMEVEFELAKLDPNGNCTNGINRIRSEYALTGTHNVKSLIHWPPDKYLNIYIVRDAAGLAGHALMPSQADSVPQWDGIVIAGGYFGNTGTSNDVKSVVLSHEVGHYFNLFHIWGGNNVPEFYYLPVGQQANCAVGDSVSDTPNTRGWSTCNLNGTTCDTVLDNVQNFMDYAYCARMFTEGQKQRVHTALNSSVAHRNNLWSAQNLTITGLSINNPLCVANFYSERRIYCVNESVKFYDASYHDPVSWNWDIGAGPTLSIENPTYSYSQAGLYDVSLTVSDGTDALSNIKENYIKVLETTGLTLPYVEGFENAANPLDMDLIFECDGNLCYDLQNDYAASGVQSAIAANYFAEGNFSYKMTTPRLNLSLTPDPVIRFKYAFAQQDTNNTDRLIIKLSKDCGKTWLTKKTIGADEISTVGFTLTSEFHPLQNEWEEVLVTGIPSFYKTDNVIVQFQFIGGGGNNFYIDDINIFDISELSVAETQLSEWKIVPNPSSDVFRIEGPFEKQYVEVFDMNGRFIFAVPNMTTGVNTEINDLPAGMYQVSIQNGAKKVWRKLIIAH